MQFRGRCANEQSGLKRLGSDFTGQKHKRGVLFTVLKKFILINIKKSSLE